MIPEEEKEPKGSTPTKRNYFVRLFTGDIPLVVTYWVWGVLVGGLAFLSLAYIVDQNYLRILTLPYGELLLNLFDYTWVAVGIFMWVAIWRSAGKYQGRFWGPVARLMVVVGVVTTVNEFSPLTDEGEPSDTDYAEQARLLNESLPMMLDENTRLESVTINDNEHRFIATLLDDTLTDFDPKMFELVSKLDIANDICNKSDSRAALDRGVTFVYSYSDAAGNHFADVSVTVDNCT